VISLAQHHLRARWLPSTGLSSLYSVRRNAKWRKSGFSSCRPYPGPRYGRPSTGQRVVRASRSWPISSRNDAASRSSMRHMAGSPPCRGSTPGRLAHRPRPHRHEFLDGACEPRPGRDNGLRVRRASAPLLGHTALEPVGNGDRLAGQQRRRTIDERCMIGSAGNEPEVVAVTDEDFANHPLGRRLGQPALRTGEDPLEEKAAALAENLQALRLTVYRREAFGQQVEVIPIPLEPTALALTAQPDREPPTTVARACRAASSGVASRRGGGTSPVGSLAACRASMRCRSARIRRSSFLSSRGPAIGSSSSSTMLYRLPPGLRVPRPSGRAVPGPRTSSPVMAEVASATPVPLPRAPPDPPLLVVHCLRGMAPRTPHLKDA
jgi:hypothetical protein